MTRAASFSFLLGVALLCEPVAAATHTFIVAGLGGEPQYEQRFAQQAAALAAAAQRLASDASHVVTLTGDKARRDSVRRELKALAQRLDQNDAVVVVLLGHGTFDGEEYRFNVPELDLTATELGRLFDELPARAQLIVNTTSASGATAERWQRPQRLVITATKSGGERTATRFAQYWTQAVTTDVADVNKDQVVTASEAFEYTARQVAAAFKADVALATEHARLEGQNAADFAVAHLGTGRLSDDVQLRTLLAQRGDIERDLGAVKERKESLSEDEYYDSLESVLVRLALLQRQIDARQASLDTGEQ